MKQTNKSSIWLIILIVCVVFLSHGCIVGELALEGGAVSDMVLEGGFVSAADAGIMSTEFEMELGSAYIERGEVNSILERVKLHPGAYGTTPKLFIEGKTTPFGEVLENNRQIKFFRDGKIITVNDNIFSVKEDVVNVSSTNRFSNFNKRGAVYKNDMVFVLGETGDGWYQVRILKNGGAIEGFIMKRYLVPIISGYTIKHITTIGDTINYNEGYQSNYGKVYSANTSANNYKHQQENSHPNNRTSQYETVISNQVNNNRVINVNITVSNSNTGVNINSNREEKTIANHFEIANLSNRQIVFQLSANDKNWHKYSLSSNFVSTFTFNDSNIYFKISTDGKTIKYKIDHSHQYEIRWNRTKGVYDLFNI